MIYNRSRHREFDGYNTHGQKCLTTRLNSEPAPMPTGNAKTGKSIALRAIKQLVLDLIEYDQRHRAQITDYNSPNCALHIEQIES